MPKKNILKIPLRLEHTKVKETIIDKNGAYHIYVSCTATSTTCHQCGRIISRSHGQCKETIIEHMPIFDEKVFIHVKWPRFVCDNCDNHPTTSFHPEWLNERGDMTKTYERFVLKTLINSTIKDTAIKLDTTEEKIQGIVNRGISTEVDWSKIKPTRIGLDEIALKKGHNHYLTIVSDISPGKRVSILAVLDGRKKDDVLPFLKSIPQKIWSALESVCVDMGAGYLASVKDALGDNSRFNDIVTIDRFHVAKLVGGAVDDERKAVIRELKKNHAGNENYLDLIKDSMWPLRGHLDDLLPEAQEKLDNLFSLSPHLEKCYELREELFMIFEGDYTKDEARSQIRNWCQRALECQEHHGSPFESFVKTYDKFQENILNYFETRASSGPVEGLNNKIKTTKRRGFGFRNVLQFAQRLFLDINYKLELLPNCY